jgi:hypothetical protein
MPDDISDVESDSLRAGQARPVHEHLRAGLDCQDKLARFPKNHDEPRAIASFVQDQHAAAAVLPFLSRDLRCFHQGQFDGRRKRLSPHPGCEPDEPTNRFLEAFHELLLEVLGGPAVRYGLWQPLECVPICDGNGSSDNFIASVWSPLRGTAPADRREPDGERVLVAVNYSAHAGQCFMRLPFSRLGSGLWRLQDLLSDARHDHDGADLQPRGLYVDLAPWGYHAFRMNLT